MPRLPQRLKVLGRNKYELYLSLVPVMATIFVMGRAPLRYQDYIEGAGALVLASVLALNGLCDWRRMHLIERIFALPYCLLLFLWTLSDVAQTLTVRGFADL